ncbi:hypothetical protein PIROE2DRAFT_1988 [Piromyces sp. E2]|nr:hypothetical protein PIROE2DRAFT_1988 [Piromyces sp. E2]|eukprot:OUM70038.1 hypothetical protein PIROE2DRAFT_1988 [Piromyces sp. E2]
MSRDRDDNKKTKTQLCESLFILNESFPYYYNYNNKIEIVYLSQISEDPKKEIRFDDNQILNSEVFNDQFFEKSFSCDEQANFENNTITFYSDYKIEIPISNNETIILKSMIDVNKITKTQSQEMICDIYSETLKLAKPMQFPYRNFVEINDFQEKAPISLLFAHLYYKHNNTNEGSFEDIINECCDIIENSLIPNCHDIDKNKINFSISKCDEKTRNMTVSYLNCRNTDSINFPNNIECYYIPLSNSRGIYIEDRCINIAGFIYLLMLIISTLILNSSLVLWIGQFYEFKCIAKIWTMIIGDLYVPTQLNLKSLFQCITAKK